MNDEELDRLEEMCGDLRDAASLCNDEQGEWWTALANVLDRVTDCGSMSFQRAYAKEVRKEHKHLKKNFEILEQEVKQTHTSRILVWKGD